MTNLPSPTTAFYYRHGTLQRAAADAYPPLPNEIPIGHLATATTTVFPSYNYLNETLGVPISIEFTPFQQNVREVPLPPRCKRCKAYLQLPFKLMGNSFTCGICGRENTDLLGLQEEAQNPAEFVCYDDVYQPASVDAAGVRDELLPPAETSHVTSEVLCYQDVRRGAFSTQLQVRDLRGARDGAVPSSQRYADRKVKQLVIEELGDVEANQDSLADSVSGGSAETKALLKKNEAQKPQTPERYKFIHVFVVQVTFNSIYQNVLATMLALIETFLATAHENVQVGIVFSMMNTLCFSYTEQKIELHEIACDATTGEPVIPVPLSMLCFNRAQIKQFHVYGRKILEYFYKQAEIYPELLRVAATTAGEALSGVVSSLQRTGGIVSLILTDRITMGLGQILPEDLAAYQFTTQDNCLLSKEAAYYNKNLFYNRLAREAAAHNVSINIVCMPYNRTAFGLMQLSPLVYLTGGSLYYNKPAWLVNNVQNTANDVFLRDAVEEIFETEAIACFFTLRCSKGVEMCLYEDEQTEELDGVLEQSRKFLKTVFKYKEKTDSQLKNIDYSTKDRVFGCFEKVSDVELSFASMKRASAFHVGIKLQSSKFGNPLMQFALLYTAQDGLRKVRVFTMQFEASEIAARVYNAANQFQIATVFSKQTASRFLYAYALQNENPQPFGGYYNSKMVVSQAEVEEKKLYENARSGNLSQNEVLALNEFSINVLKSDLRQHKFLLFQDGGHCLKRQYQLQQEVLGNLKTMLKGFSVIAGMEAYKERLLIPQPLQILPLYFHALCHSEVCARGRQSNEGGTITADHRVAQAQFWFYEACGRVCNSLVCGVFDLNSIMTEQRGFAEQNAHLPLPPTSYSVKDLFSGLYLFVSSQHCFLNVGKSCNKELLSDVLGASDTLPGFVEEFSSDAANIFLQNVKRVFQYKGAVYICQDGCEFEGQRRWMMALDGFSQGVGYSDFLQTLPTMIK